MFEKFLQLAIICKTLRHLLIHLEITSPIFQKNILSTLKITNIIISNSFLTTNRLQNPSTSGATFFLRTLPFRIFLTISLASAKTSIFIISSISSTNRLSNIGTSIARNLIGLIGTLSKIFKIGLITLHFTQIPISHSILCTSRHKNLRTKLTTI